MKIAVVGSRKFGKKYRYETKEAWLEVICTWFRYLRGDDVDPYDLDPDREQACRHMHRVLSAEFQPGDVLVSGGAYGADLMAETWAEVNGFTDPLIFLAEWEKYGKKRAGFIRNQTIIDHSDRVIAFWKGHSTGTQDTLRRAQAKRLPCLIEKV